MIIITNEQYKSGFMLEEYNGTYSLVNAYEDKNGEAQMKWAYIEKREKKGDKWEGVPGKKLPWKIELGTREEAIANLKAALAMLGAELPGPEDFGNPDKQDHQNISGGDPEFSDIPY